MARSNKPVAWSLFAGGGTLAAFLTPVLIIITGLAVPLGFLSGDILSYERALTVLQNPFGKLVIFGIIFLQLWHAAHRLRITAHDFGIRADTAVMIICYGLAALATVVTIFTLLNI